MSVKLSVKIDLKINFKTQPTRYSVTRLIISPYIFILSVLRLSLRLLDWRHEGSRQIRLIVGVAVPRYPGAGRSDAVVAAEGHQADAVRRRTPGVGAHEGASQNWGRGFSQGSLPTQSGDYNGLDCISHASQIIEFRNKNVFFFWCDQCVISTIPDEMNSWLKLDEPYLLDPPWKYRDWEKITIFIFFCNPHRLSPTY